MVFTRILASLLLTAIGTSAQCWNFAYGPIDGSTCYSDPFSLSYLEVFVVDDHLDPNCHSGTNVTAYVTFTDVLEVVHVHEPVVKSFVFEDDTEATFPLSFPVAFSTIKDGSEVTVTVIASSPPALPTLTCEFSFTVEATAIALETVTTSQTLTLVSSSTISRFLPSGISMFGRAPAGIPLTVAPLQLPRARSSPPTCRRRCRLLSRGRVKARRRSRPRGPPEP